MATPCPLAALRYSFGLHVITRNIPHCLTLSWLLGVILVDVYNFGPSGFSMANWSLSVLPTRWSMLSWSLVALQLIDAPWCYRDQEGAEQSGFRRVTSKVPLPSISEGSRGEEGPNA